MIDRIDPNTATQESFFRDYVSKRKPCILTTFTSDLNNIRQWKEIAHLRTQAGHCPVQIEPMSKEEKQFGSNEKRIDTTLGAFLDKIEAGNNQFYLTTQYDSQEDMILSPPCQYLRRDFPIKPSMLSNLVLQQVNLWIGISKEGSSSGLHHDSADNLYALISGSKRFVLFPPSSVTDLYPYGDVDQIHPNGLISYKHAPMCASGILKHYALQVKLDVLSQRIQATTDAEQREALEEEKDQAEDEMLQLELEAAQGADEGDDFDAMGFGIADDDDDDAVLDALDGSGADFDLGNSDSEQEQEQQEEQEEQDRSHPPTFSKIPSALLHAQLGLGQHAKSDISDIPAEYKRLEHALPHAEVVHLNAGEMLYLPASYLHEVTSTSSTDAAHVAFNYWFFPPDNLNSVHQPYEDTLVWDHIRQEQDVQFSKGKGKRKRADSSSSSGRVGPGPGIHVL